jgi:hypothetical protein
MRHWKVIVADAAPRFTENDIPAQMLARPGSPYQLFFYLYIYIYRRSLGCHLQYQPISVVMQHLCLRPPRNGYRPMALEVRAVKSGERRRGLTLYRNDVE